MGTNGATGEERTGPLAFFGVPTDNSRHPEATKARVVPTPKPSDPTAVLISHVRGGHDLAREYLLARYLPILRHWARGRIPPVARGMSDTDDLVQTTLIRVLKRIETLDIQREGAFLAYLRTSLLNALRDDLRLSVNRSHREPIPDTSKSADRSPLDRLIDQDTYEAYETALGTLSSDQQEAVILRLEFQMSYAEIADAVGVASADAARMKVTRAVAKLAEALDAHR